MNKTEASDRSKRSENLEKCRQNTAKRTAETIHDWTGSDRTPVTSPDKVPRKFRMFGPLKEAIRRRRFPADEDITDAVKNWLNMQPQFFSDRVKKPVKRWLKCVEVDGDYVEQQRRLHLSVFKIYNFFKSPLIL
jgi:hypothetical protein